MLENLYLSHHPVFLYLLSCYTHKMHQNLYLLRYPVFLYWLICYNSQMHIDLYLLHYSVFLYWLSCYNQKIHIDLYLLLFPVLLYRLRVVPTAPCGRFWASMHLLWRPIALIIIQLRISAELISAHSALLALTGSCGPTVLVSGPAYQFSTLFSISVLRHRFISSANKD